MNLPRTNFTVGWTQTFDPHCNYISKQNLSKGRGGGGGMSHARCSPQDRKQSYKD